MSRPIVVYDDDCGFCTWSVEFADARGEFYVVGFSELDADLRERLPDDWESCAHLVMDGSVYSCGRAAEETLARLGPGWRAAIAAFRLVPFRHHVRDPLYRWIADHRPAFGRLLRRGRSVKKRIHLFKP